MKQQYVTITGFSYYYGTQPFVIGNLIRCCKEPKNLQDAEAIQCRLPCIGTVGYIANSTHTVAGGTMSAGRIYDLVPDKFFVRVLFTTKTKIICQVESGDPAQLAKELFSQMDDDEDRSDNEI